MAKGKQDLEAQAEKARKAKVDADNKKKNGAAAKTEALLAKTPLTNEERDFCDRTKSRMNEGRKVAKPSSAEILRYSKLRKRYNVS